MLTRFRIEVEGGDSAAATEAELTKYEHALQWTEASRYRCHRDDKEAKEPLPGWHDADVTGRSFFNSELGREVTDEVIEYDPGLPAYRGRRVVRFKRIDTRSPIFRPELAED